MVSLGEPELARDTRKVIMTKQIDLGTPTVHPSTSITAGTYTSIRYIYRVGHPIDYTGYVRISFRYAGDFGVPQFNQPDGPNYCVVSTTGDCRSPIYVHQNEKKG